MPLRPPPSHHAPSSSQTRNFVRPSTTYAAPPPPPHQQHQQFEQTAHGRHARLSALEEDEEDYWGGQEEEGLEQALVGLEAGVLSGGGDFRGGAGASLSPSHLMKVEKVETDLTFLTSLSFLVGRQPAPQAFQRNPKPSQTQPPQHYFPSRDTQHYQQQQQPQQQQEPQVAYLEDLDPFASTRPGFVRPQAQSYSASRGGGGMQTNATGGNRGMEGGGEVGGGGGAKKGIKLRPVSELRTFPLSLVHLSLLNATLTLLVGLAKPICSALSGVSASSMPFSLPASIRCVLHTSSVLYLIRCSTPPSHPGLPLRQQRRRFRSNRCWKDGSLRACDHQVVQYVHRL